jgi:hypothetical protein
MRIRLPEESVEYFEGEQVLIALIPNKEPVLGRVKRKLGRFLYEIESSYIKGSDKLVLTSRELRKYEKE